MRTVLTLDSLIVFILVIFRVPYEYSNENTKMYKLKICIKYFSFYKKKYRIKRYCKHGRPSQLVVEQYKLTLGILYANWRELTLYSFSVDCLRYTKKNIFLSCTPFVLCDTCVSQTILINIIEKTNIKKCGKFLKMNNNYPFV